MTATKLDSCTIARSSCSSLAQTELSTDELRDYAELSSDARRRDWIAGRRAAKRAVAAHCSIPSAHVRIAGRPGHEPLAWLENGNALSLSISHHDRHALAAVVDRPARVGVDIARVGEIASEHQRYFLGPSERAIVEQIGVTAVWTLKEAASHVYTADVETPYSLAREAAETLVREQGMAPESVDTLVYCGTPSVALADGGNACDASSLIGSTRRFEYPATRLQYDLGLECASTIAIDQLACTSLFAAVRLARALCCSGEAQRVLCVSSEFFPSHAGREAIFNCTPDAACALIVDAAGERADTSFSRPLAQARESPGVPLSRRQ